MRLFNIAGFHQDVSPACGARGHRAISRLRALVSANEFDAIAEQFEKDERERFGEDGFEKMVDRVARLERMVGINDLNQYTPPR
jgi:hypothetical protein